MCLCLCVYVLVVSCACMCQQVEKFDTGCSLGDSIETVTTPHHTQAAARERPRAPGCSALQATEELKSACPRGSQVPTLKGEPAKWPRQEPLQLANGPQVASKQ